MYLKPILIFVLTSIVGSVSSEIYFRKGAPHVKLGNEALLSGTVKFSREGRPFSSFLGLPYATVPERFADPEPLKDKPWDGVRRSVAHGPVCLQQLLPERQSFGDEDCLSLSVHVPMNNTGKKGYPVMVWIHGGGFVYGSGALYGPEYFMDEDVILVTINYRLGVFGFLSTGDEVLSGNQGLKDQVMALRWIQDNIKFFGGDPGKVTIFGESAGGASVHYLTLSSMAKGLFHRAIAQSGSALGLWAHETNPKSKAVDIATYLNCPTAASNPVSISSEEIVTCLRGKTSDELNDAQFKFRTAWPLNSIPIFFSPTTEPQVTTTSKHTPFLTESPWSILTDKTKKAETEVPIIFGLTEDEGVDLYASLVLGMPALMEEINKDWDTVIPNALLLDKTLTCPKGLKVATDKLKEFYFGTKEVSAETEDALTNLYSDALVVQAVHRAALETALRSKKAPVYIYQYAHKGPSSFMGLALTGKKTPPKKVGHADELPFQFDMSEMMPAMKGLLAVDSDDENLSKNFIKLWVSFAKHGVPKYTWGSVPRWNPISKKEADGTQTLKLLRIDSDLQIIEDSSKERVALWNTIWEEHLLPGAKLGKNKKGKTEL